MPRPSWRRIESALIDLLRAEGFAFDWDKGDTWVCTNNRRICLRDLAKQLEERL